MVIVEQEQNIYRSRAITQQINRALCLRFDARGSLLPSLRRHGRSTGVRSDNANKRGCLLPHEAQMSYCIISPDVFRVSLN